MKNEDDLARRDKASTSGVGDPASSTSVLRADLDPLPLRLRKLPIDARGYPVPWFVPFIDGVPEFRAADSLKFIAAVKQKLCWVCGEGLGRWIAFPIGPMCAITRTTAEPPCHVECAEWSIIHCPFLSQPRQVRREGGVPDGIEEPGGFAIKRNPGVTCLWITRGYELFDDGRGKPPGRDRRASSQRERGSSL